MTLIALKCPHTTFYTLPCHNTLIFDDMKVEYQCCFQHFFIIGSITSDQWQNMVFGLSNVLL
jgi:hypothetical protein